MSNDDVLVEPLRGANPVPRSVSASDAARRAALLEEILNMPIDTKPSSSSPAPNRRRRLRFGAFVVAGATAAAAVVALIVAQTADRTSRVAAPTTSTVASSTSPTGTGTSTGAVGVGSCVEFYDLTTLTHREMAFDGTVEAVDGNQVTFSVGEWFKGGSGATITLDGNGLAGGVVTSAGGSTLNIGQRFVVAGDGGFVWSCGYTQAYSVDVATAWRSALDS